MTTTPSSEQPTAGPGYRFTDPRLEGDGLVDDVDVAPPGQGIEAELDDDGRPSIDALVDGDLLALAEEEFTEPVDLGVLVVRVERRRGDYTLEYDLNKASDERNIQTWERRATYRDKSAGNVERLDRLKFAALLIANTNVGILRAGVYLTEPGTGERLTFRHKRIVRMMGAASPTAAVVKFLTDPGAISHGDAIANHTGYGDRAETLDPTPGS